MRILLAIDDSPPSAAAADELFERPWPAGTTVRVLCVIRPVRPVATELWFVGAADLDLAEKEITARMHELIRRTADRLRGAGLTTEERMRHGDPRTEIVDEASEWNADLILLGSHGYTGLTRLLLGSVAQYVVSHAPCSVEVVRRKSSESENKQGQA
jgi:nucleotide-binding universal stress UspA family protein